MSHFHGLIDFLDRIRSSPLLRFSFWRFLKPSLSLVLWSPVPRLSLRSVL